MDVLKTVLEASISGSVVILLVLVLRLALQKAPKRLVCLLWLLVGIRLLLPVHVQTSFSLQPDIVQLTQSMQRQEEAVQPDMVPAIPVPGDDVVVSTGDAQVVVEVTRATDWGMVAAIVWAAGTAAMLGYAALSYFRLRRQVRGAVQAEDGAWESERLNSAFLFGYLKPRIFLPADLRGKEREYVLSHERVHIVCGDHWIKLVGFLCLSLHWFNPLVWIAYRLLCRDLEMACDEQVVKRYSVEERKAYSQALLSCSVGSRPVSACPIAFGEVDVKERIMKILNYRKPGFWICLVCVIAIIVTAVFFLTDQKPKYDTVFEEYAAMIGLDKDKFYRNIGTTEEKGTIAGIHTHVLSEPLEIDGVKYWISVYYDEPSDNRISSVEFMAEPFGSFDEMAEKYLSMYELLYGIYGETEDDSEGYTDLQQMQSAYEKRVPKRGSWGAYALWSLEDVTEMYPEAQDYMNYLSAREDVIDNMKYQYGSEVVPKYWFEVSLSCKAEDEQYRVTARFYIKVNPWRGTE